MPSVLLPAWQLLARAGRGRAFPSHIRRCPAVGGTVLAATHGVHSRVAVSMPCTSGVSALRNGHGRGSPSKSALRALGTSALVVPKPFLPAAVFLLFPGKALPCRERGAQGTCARSRGRPAGGPLTSQEFRKWCVCLGEIKPASHHILKQAGAGTLLGRHGVLLKPLQMEQMFHPPFMLLSPAEEHKTIWGLRYSRSTTFGLPSAAG